MNYGADIEASYDRLFSQAKDTVEEYMTSATYRLDAKFGEGYAKKNPALLAAMVAAMSDDFTTAANSKAMLAVADRLTFALDTLATAIETYTAQLAAEPEQADNSGLT